MCVCVFVFCEPQMLLSKYFFLLSIIMKMHNKLYIDCILFTEVKRMTSLSCKWKQALALLCVYSVAARRTAPRGTRRKTRKSNETCLRATMKEELPSDFNCTKWKRNSRDEGNLLVIDTINLCFNWKRGKHCWKVLGSSL